MTADDNEVFQGGVNVVTRVGDTVRRPVGPWTAAVHALLQHLEQQGFAGAPRAHGFDDEGREILDFLPGEVGNYPLSEQARSEPALLSAGRLLRGYHDATASLVDHEIEDWRLGAIEPTEVICHGDVAPCNCVFNHGEATALIDFDFAGPGPRAWDLAYALYRFAPLVSPSNPDGFGLLTEQATRARQFLDSYGATLGLREDAVTMLVPRLQWLIDYVRSAAEAGDEAFAQHIADGHDDLYLRDIAYIQANGSVWEHVVVND